MSSVKQPDSQTELIVFGYMKDAQTLFGYTTNPYYTIPADIAQVTLSYLYNYFSNDGIYEWKIDDKQMVNKMLNAKCGDKFESDSFMMARLPWKLEICPNGDTQDFKGYLKIRLKLLSLPSNIDKVVIRRIFRVLENMAGSSWIFELSEGQYAFWGKKCPLSELIDMKCETITINIEISVHKIILKEKDETLVQNDLTIETLTSCPSNTNLTYKMHGNELEMFKKSKNGKQFMCGDIVDNMWCLSVCPNGDRSDTNGYIGIYAELCGLPPNIKRIKVTEKIVCVEIDRMRQYTVDMSMDNTEWTWGCKQLIELESVMDLDQLTFIVDIDVLSVEQSKYDNYLEITHPLQITQLLST